MELAYIERHLSNFLAFDDALTYLTSTEGVEPLSSKTKLKLYCTQPGTQGDSAMSVHGVSVTAGRPKFMELLAEAADVKPAPEKKLVIGVYSCGPPKMMAAVRAAVQGASNSAAKFYLHEETFEL